MELIKCMKKKEVALSPIISIILMVAITIPIAATVYVYTSDMAVPEQPPSIVFMEIDQYDTSQLRVISSDSADWEDIEITYETADQFGTIPSLSGQVEAGQLIDCPNYQCTVYVTHKPTNKLIYKGEFTAAPAATPVREDNNLPVANDDHYDTYEDTFLNVDVPEGVLANDEDDDGPEPLTAELVSNVSHGILSFSPDGSFAYLPEPDWNGIDHFTYKAWDGENYSNVSTATITVYPVNDPPSKPTITGPAYVYKTIDYTFTANTADPEGAQLYYNFSWGDGNYTGWIGPYDSGTDASASHTWTNFGLYNVQVQAKDTDEYMSLWSDVLSYAITIPGDFDDSCTVDMTDFTIFANAYPSSEGDPNWDPRCDLNDSGNVDMTDFTIFANWYGKSC